MSNYLSDNLIAIIGTIIALIALVQPYASRIFSFYLGRIAIYPEHWLELNITNIGEIISLNGMIYPVRGDFIVRQMSAKITRTDDGFSARFDWAYNKETSLTAQQNESNRAVESSNTGSFKPVISFHIKQGQAANFNLVFMDVERSTVLGKKLFPITEYWMNQIRQRPLVDISDYHRRVSQLLSEKNVVQPAITDTMKYMMWRPSKYRIEIFVETRRPMRIFSVEGQFEITKENTAVIASNVLPILYGCTGQGQIAKTPIICPVTWKG